METLLVDANILINACRTAAVDHVFFRDWLSEVVGKNRLLIAETVEVALIRVCSSASGLKSNAMPIGEILAFRDALFAAPNVSRVSAGPHHDRIFRELVSAHKVTGNLVNDAWLAALAIENHVTLVSADADFRKFKGLRWLNPLR